MSKYFVKTNINMQPKNKAWVAAQEFAEKHNCTLILDTRDKLLEDYISRVKDKVQEINQEHPKCKDMVCNALWLPGQEKHCSLFVMVDGDLVFSLTIYSVNTELSDN